MGRKRSRAEDAPGVAADVSDFLGDLNMPELDLPPEDPGGDPNPGSPSPDEVEDAGPPQSAPAAGEMGAPPEQEPPAPEPPAEDWKAKFDELQKEAEGMKKVMAKLAGSNAGVVAPPQSQPAPVTSGTTAAAASPAPAMPLPAPSPPQALDATSLLGDFDPTTATREEWAQYLMVRDRRIMEQTLLHAGPMVSDIYDQKDAAVRLYRDHLDKPENAWIREYPEEVFYTYLRRTNDAHPGQHPRQLLDMATREFAEDRGRAQAPSTETPAAPAPPRAEAPATVARPAARQSRSAIGQQIDSMLMGFEPGSGRL
jgi:hypothetical protein